MKLLTNALKAICAGAAALLLAPTAANAGASVSWTSPANGSLYPVGAKVSPTGNASAFGSTGGGLDLVIVMDSSGSMGSTVVVNGVTTTRQQAQKDAVIALVNSLPAGTTSVSIVEFDSNANVVQTLLPLTPASNLTQIISAINSVDASGSTTIGTGIDAAASELAARGTAGRSQQMIVLSDGSSSGTPANNAAAAVAGGVDSVNAVALPGANIATMQSIATAGNGAFIDVSNDLGALVGVFTGTGGNLVGIDKVEVTYPDGTTAEVTVDGFGNFTADETMLMAASNTFVATAYATDGTQASATLTLRTSQVPLPAAAWLFGVGLAGIGALKRRRAA